MSCQDDPIPLTDDIVAERAARLAKVAEETCLEHFGEADLEYVIGTEVPVPAARMKPKRAGGHHAGCRPRHAGSPSSRL